MGDLKLFRIENGTAVELQGTALALERPLQVLIDSEAASTTGSKWRRFPHFRFRLVRRCERELTLCAGAESRVNML